MRPDQTLINGSFPARITSEAAARLLGFQPHDMPVLIANKHLKPLGKPVPNATKYFALCQIAECALDVEWLKKATQLLYAHWKGQNAKRVRGPQPCETAQPSGDQESQVALSE